MKFLSVFLLVCILFSAGTTAKKMVCYWSSWAVYYGGDGAVVPEDLDANLCTHINYAFAQVNSDGTISSEDKETDINDKGYSRIIALKEQNPDLKVLLSIGGADAPAKTFSSIAADPELRAAMVSSARSFMETYGFDGVDFDWEVPGADDKDNFVSLLQDFRDDFDKDDWLLSAAVSADVSDGYDVPSISDILDHINVMTYDMYGPWSDYTGQNSPLYPSSVEDDWEKENLNMEAAITQWIEAGADPGKLLAGVAFYGHSFATENYQDNTVHAPITGTGSGGPFMKEEGSWSYIEFCDARKSWHCNWDDEQKMRICVSGYQWLGIDDEGSLRNKAAFINSHNLGGAMVWSIDMDDVHGYCNETEPAQPLLHAIADSLKP